MPRKCCVPNCRSNYRGTQYLTCFRFPKDETLKAKWIKKIPRANFVPVADSVVCSKHFDDKFVINFDELPSSNGPIRIKRGKPRLTDDAYPSIFLNVPSYLSEIVKKRETDPNKRAAKLDRHYEDQFENDLQELQSRFALNKIEDLVGHLNDGMLCSGWIYHVTKDYVDFFFHKTEVLPPQLKAFIRIKKDMTYEVFVNDLEFSIQRLKKLGCPQSKIISFQEVEHLLVTVKHLSSDEATPDPDKWSTLTRAISDNLIKYHEYLVMTDNAEACALLFFIEQLKMMNSQKNLNSYSSETKLFAYMLFIKSTSAYDFIRDSGVIKLPHPQLLRQMSRCLSSSSDSGNFHYLKTKTQMLKEEEKLVNLLIDEIHIQPTMQYKAGKLIGSSTNQPEILANSVHTFMISSIFSNNKDVVSFLPVKKLSAEQLYEHTKSSILALENIGYKVLCIVSDNNSVNRKMFKIFLENSRFPSPIANHPVSESRPLFLIFDTVHLLKCIRNNWISRGKCFMIPPFPDMSNLELTADFHNLIRVYEAEKHLPVKYGYMLTENALYPTNLQKQKVSLALKVFDRSNINALNHLGPNQDILHWKGTAIFLQIIVQWWEIVNVKSCFKGIRKRNINMNPVDSVDNPQVAFLKQFAQWVDSWREKYSNIDKGGLSQETFQALIHTCNTFIRLIYFVLEDENWKYVLLGKFQTDNLEARFGQYRQLSGCNYNVSLMEIYESERKLKISSLLKLKSARFGELSIKELFMNFEVSNERNISDCEFIDLCISEDISYNFSQDEMNNITYITGYACYSLCKKLLCTTCIDLISTKDLLQLDVNSATELINECNRGGLTYPAKVSVKAVLVAYSVFQKLISKDLEEKFLNCSNHLYIFITVVNSFLHDDNEIANSSYNCKCGNNLLDLLKKILVPCGNIFIKNYAQSKLCSKISAKRKLMTFTK